MLSKRISYQGFVLKNNNILKCYTFSKSKQILQYMRTIYLYRDLYFKPCVGHEVMSIVFVVLKL